MTADKFELSSALDRLAARACADIKSDKKKERAAAELRGHLEDAANDIMRRGVSPEAAYGEVEKSLGDVGKLAEIMASVHNSPHVPAPLIWLSCAAVVSVLLCLYFTAENRIIRSCSGALLQTGALCVLIAIILLTAGYVRAMVKRASAVHRLKKLARESGGTLTVRKSCYSSIFVRGNEPEILLDIKDRRYVLYLWATVRHRRTLHLRDNGLYSNNKHIGYMLAGVLFPYGAGVWGFHAKAADHSARTAWYYSSMVKISRDIHLMPEIDYAAYFVNGKTNLPVLLLNPIPMNVEVTENGRIHSLTEGERLPDALGGAAVYSASGFISAARRAFERERL